MFKGTCRWIWPLVTVLAVAGIVFGLARGDFEVVNRWGHTLCTSCIGLGR